MTERKISSTGYKPFLKDEKDISHSGFLNLKKLDDEAYEDMMSFLYMLKCGTFPVTNISFQLFSDTVRWYSAKKRRSTVQGRLERIL